MKKRRFVSKCPIYNLLFMDKRGQEKCIELNNREGLLTDNPEIIIAIISSGDYRDLVLEVETPEELEASRQAQLTKLLGGKESACPLNDQRGQALCKEEQLPLNLTVEPLSVPDLKAENLALEEEAAREIANTVKPSKKAGK